VGRNLILHDIGPNQIGCQVSCASRGPNPLYGKGIACLTSDAPYSFLDSGDGLSRVSEVGMGDNAIFPIGEDNLGRDGSHIDS
jgi:hypothetical protein